MESNVLITEDKGYGFWERLGESCLTLVEHPGGVFVASDPAAVQSIYDTYTLTDACDYRARFIKSKARELILARYQEWKQQNMTARATELNSIELGRALTEAEAAEKAALLAAWQWICEVRRVSNEHETAMRSLLTFAAVNAYRYDVGWPAC